MKITSTDFESLFIIEPRVFPDARGYFFESYSQRALTECGFNNSFVQDNESSSCYGTIRGLHFQKTPHAQTKLIRVLQGIILDVVVDLRVNSKTYGKVFTIELSEENKKQLLIPRGFAHGFSVLSEKARILYKCDNFYAPTFEGGILYNDPELAIDWKIPPDSQIISSKDVMHPNFKDIKNDLAHWF